MGAGFGGSIISIVRKEKVDEIVNILNEKYYIKYKIKPGFIICNSSDGTKKID